MYINFEGIDGCGKTSVLDAIYWKYSMKGVCEQQVIKTKEPQGVFRDIVLDPDNKLGLNEVARFFIYQADRAVHTENVIKPNWGKLILCDRGILSTLCYQHITTGLPLYKLFEITSIACDVYLPRLIFVFNVSYDNSLKRRAGRVGKDHWEKMGSDFFEKLSSRYKVFGQELTEKFHIPVIQIDTNNKTLEEVIQKVDSVIEQTLKFNCPGTCGT